MPNKMIYVADTDLPLFERARALAGGNLSAAIVQAVRRFIEIREAQVEGYDDVEVRVGNHGIYHRKRFVGRRIAQWKHKPDQDQTIEYFVVYQTQRGKYAVHSKRQAVQPPVLDPGSLPGEAGWQAGSNWQDINEHWANVTELDEWEPVADAEFTLTVHDDLEALKAGSPPELGRLTELSSNQLPVEELDI